MISKRIKELRNKKEISQRDLAEILGLSQQAIAKWEIGKSEPDIETLKKLSAIFEVDIKYLLGEIDIPVYYNTKNSPSDDIAERAKYFEKLLIDNGIIKANYTKENLDVLVDFLRVNKSFLEPQLNKKNRTSTSQV